MWCICVQVARYALNPFQKKWKKRHRSAWAGLHSKLRISMAAANWFFDLVNIMRDLARLSQFSHLLQAKTMSLALKSWAPDEGSRTAHNCSPVLSRQTHSKTSRSKISRTRRPATNGLDYCNSPTKLKHAAATENRSFKTAQLVQTTLQNIRDSPQSAPSKSVSLAANCVPHPNQKPAALDDS